MNSRLAKGAFPSGRLVVPEDDEVRSHSADRTDEILADANECHIHCPECCDESTAFGMRMVREPMFDAAHAFVTSDHDAHADPWSGLTAGERKAASAGEIEKVHMPEMQSIEGTAHEDSYWSRIGGLPHGRWHPPRRTAVIGV